MQTVQVVRSVGFEALITARILSSVGISIVSRYRRSFFFALHGEHGHAVGEFVAFGADVGGDVGERQFFLMRR